MLQTTILKPVVSTQIDKQKLMQIGKTGYVGLKPGEAVLVRASTPSPPP